MNTNGRIALPSLRDLGLPIPSRPHNINTPTHQLRPLRMNRPRRDSISSSNTYDSDMEIERTPSLSPPSNYIYPPVDSFASTIMPQTPSPAPVSQTQRRRARSRVETAAARQNFAFKLVLTTLPKADAILFVPAPGRGGTAAVAALRANDAPISQLARQNQNQNQNQDRAEAGPSSAAAAAAPSAPLAQTPQTAQRPNHRDAFLLVGPKVLRMRTPAGLARLQDELDRGARIYAYRTVPIDPRRYSAPASIATVARV